MKKAFCLLFAASALTFVSCKSLILNYASTALSGANKKGIPVKQKADSANPLLAITGETDDKLVADFFPTILKMYELMQAANPKHAGLASMTGSLNVMYANAFVAAPAEDLPVENYDEQNAEYGRAKLHYLRGRDLCLSALDIRHEGFKNAVLSGDEKKLSDALLQTDKNDVASLYWAGAGWLGAFSLDPLDPDLLGALRSPRDMLEKAASLDADYGNGAVWDLLSAFYISAPSDFGGDAKRAVFCHKEAMRASGGKTPGPYVTYAESFCIPNADEKGFVSSLKKALAINPDKNENTRLMTIITQKKARKLLAKKDDYFLKW